MKDWKYAISHPKNLILGDVSKRVTTHSKLLDIYGHVAFISHNEPKNFFEAKATHIEYLQSKKNSINLSVTRLDILFLGPMIGQLLALNVFLGIS